MSIRYLVLWPSPNHDDPLICTLHNTPLASVPRFEAISYVWGSNQKVARISCFDRDNQIISSLETVLRHLRLADKERTHWADSIWINQEDRKEQGNQVALMGDIYRAATRMLAYLGKDPDGHGQNVASLVADINKLIATQLEDYADHDSIPALISPDSLSKDQRWPSVTTMYQSAWFTRVWVIQEAALAREGVIIWGHTEIPWAGICELQHWLLTKAKRVWFENRLFLNDLHRPGYWMESEPVPNFVEVLARKITGVY